MNRIVILILLSFSAVLLLRSPVRAQVTDSLSVDSEVFFKQISSILLATPSKVYEKKAEELLGRFYQRWTIGRFSKTEKDEIRSLIETMRAKKMRSFPYLYDYISTLTLLAESTQPPKSVLAWHAYADSLLTEKSANSFADFLAFTSRLLETDELHEKRSYVWSVRQARFRFDLDTTFLLRFERLNLVCSSRKDSSVIEKTEGVFVYNVKQWIGSGGVLKWSRFGEKSGEDLYAEIPTYSIDLNEPSFAVDSVKLFYKRFFDHPVLGVLRDRVLASAPSDRSVYPSFTAYDENMDFPRIYENMDYHGGLQIEGNSFYGVGINNQQAVITITKNDTIFGKLKSDRFRIMDDNAISAHATTIFYLDQDSIYHPGLKVKYTNDDNQLVLYSAETNSNMIPFFDSYHQLDIYVQALFWNMNENEMLFKRIRSVKDRNLAYFVSSNHYSERDFYGLQGIDELHPLYTIQNFLRDYKVDVIQLYALADYMKKSPEQISAMLINLSNEGFLVYNTETQTAYPKDRLNYFLNAKTGDTDYDVIRLESNVSIKPNAALDITSLGLNVYGVPEVSISDSQEVYIYPYDRNIQFFKNRDFNFNGRVHMGLLDFYTQNSTFIYDSFLLRMNYVDSLSFMVKYQDSLRRSDSLIHVKNVITNLNGSIYIDDPLNKSGRKQFPQYPIFVSNDESYVYYNRRSIMDSTLLADKFYYRVDPFVFDSIKTFSTDGLAFDGTLISSGIFPDITEPLVVTPDYSLGFTHSTPNEGYSIYHEKGQFFDTISLSNKGFSGRGLLNYLSALAESDQFLFYPDSLIATAQTFMVEKSPTEFDFPMVQGDTVDLNWQIDTNIMTANNLNKPFVVYENSLLKGTLRLNPAFMLGEGAFYFDRSELLSKEISFKHNSLSADTSDFYLKNKDYDTLVFYANQYQSNINFETQSGFFNHLYNNSFVGFPFNKYISTLDEIEWRMTDDILFMQSNLGKDYQGLDTLNNLEVIDYKLIGPEFISTKPNQDSLRFFAGQATYDLNSYIIDVENVKLIKVADAAIFPGDKRVRILRDAAMETLTSAEIIADTSNKYHRFYQAEIAISGKHLYSGKGWIDYIDRFGAKQPVYMSQIGVNAAGTTIATGQTMPDEIFFLSPEYLYQGAIDLMATYPHLYFNGGYRLNQECTLNYNDWVAVSQSLNPGDLSFNIADSTFDLENRRVYFGLAYDDNYRKYYPMVMQPLRAADDRLLLNATGALTFDTIGKQYKAFSKTRGNHKEMILSTERCVLSGKGDLNLGTDFGLVSATYTGHVDHLIVVDSTQMSLIMALNFFFDDKLLDMMTDSLRLSYNEGVTDTKGRFSLFLENHLPADIKAEEVMSELSLYGQIRKLPELLKQSLILTDLNLYWDSYTRSYYSTGRIGVGYLGGNTINKYLDGYLHIEPGTGGSAFSLYLRASENQWYFFSYKMGIMQALSSDQKFNERLETLKPEKRILNANSETDYYEFVISTKRKVVDFLREMESR